MSTKITGAWVLALATAFAGLGCSHNEGKSAADPSMYHAGDVAVFTSGVSPTGQELGIVVARGQEGTDVRELHAELVRRTRELGGNAVVIAPKGSLVKEKAAVYTALSSAHDCGASCAKGDASTKGDLDHREAVVELRGKAMRVSAEELNHPAARKAP